MFNKIYNNLNIISLIYLIIPLFIFILGFLKIYISIPLCILIIYCIYKFIKNEKNIIKHNNFKYNKKYIYKYLIISSIIIFLWLFFSGIGSFSFQNHDFHVRNAMLHDLVKFDWPLIFKFNNIDPIYIKQFGLKDGVGIVYYFSYWLPSALLGKIFGLSFANIFLFIWSFIGLMLILLLINKYNNKLSYIVLLFFILFSGFDFIISFFSGSSIFGIDHLEWWNTIIQYSSNTTCLYWVFNQVIPCWLIVAMLFNIKKSNSILLVSSLCFLYSPWATIGLIPIAIYFYIKNLKEKDIKSILKSFITLETILSLCILIIYGSFYSSVSGSITVKGFLWDIIDKPLYIVIYIYLLFIIFEVLFYFVLLFKSKKNDILYWIIVIELLLIPFYVMTPANDFCMRVSLPGLFILFIYTACFFSNYDYSKIFNSKYTVFISFIVFILLFLSFVNPIHEINRSIYYTFTMDRSFNIKDRELFSMSNPKTYEMFKLCNKQFYSKNYNDKFFYKYLSK